MKIISQLLAKCFEIFREFIFYSFSIFRFNSIYSNNLWKKSNIKKLLKFGRSCTSSEEFQFPSLYAILLRVMGIFLCGNLYVWFIIIIKKLAHLYVICMSRDIVRIVLSNNQPLAQKALSRTEAILSSDRKAETIFFLYMKNMLLVHSFE